MGTKKWGEAKYDYRKPLKKYKKIKIRKKYLGHDILLKIIRGSCISYEELNPNQYTRPLEIADPKVESYFYKCMKEIMASSFNLFYILKRAETFRIYFHWFFKKSSVCIYF